MQILILEDDLARRDAFRYKLSEYEHSMEFVENPLLAIEMLHTNSYDGIFLDHDLGAILDGKTVARCFYGSKNLRAHVLVHSINPSGSVEMQKILNDLHVNVVRVPFTSMVFWSCAKKMLEGATGANSDLSSTP